ncbi:MAG TPA: exodeoxyribonuclease VII large subunit [Candidatus Dormibacteraeota bacterium]|nr:exodeoxyribonuclease VII large subunit [Candidatus Dormibacteraeota bacterium]
MTRPRPARVGHDTPQRVFYHSTHHVRHLTAYHGEPMSVLHPKPAEAEEQQPLSIPELAELVNQTLGCLRGVRFRGEVMGIQRAEKITRFTVKDEGGKIEAKIFNFQLARTKAIPEEGKTFVFTVERFDLYAPYGRFSVLVDGIEYDAEGDLRRQYAELYARLEAEGAFDERRKRPLPKLPRRVGVITSTVGKVQEDIKQTIWERFPNMEIRLYAAKVQGAASAASIVNAFERVRREGFVDVVILARGGGSFEELFSFNTEPVVRAVMACPVPVVSAIGHGPDVFLSDLVADVTAITPTAAASRVVPVRADLEQALQRSAGRLRDGAHAKLRRERERLAALEHRLGLFSPSRRLAEERRRLESLASTLRARGIALLRERRSYLSGRASAARLGARLAAQVALRRQRLRELEATLDRHDPRRWIPQRERELAGRRERLARIGRDRLRAEREELTRLAADLERATAAVVPRRAAELERRRVGPTLDRLIRRRLAEERSQLASRAERLRALDPSGVLGRGYSITRDAETQHVLRSATEAEAGRRVEILLGLGSLGALVEEVRKEG